MQSSKYQKEILKEVRAGSPTVSNENRRSGGPCFHDCCSGGAAWKSRISQRMTGGGSAPEGARAESPPLPQLLDGAVWCRTTLEIQCVPLEHFVEPVFSGVTATLESVVAAWSYTGQVGRVVSRSGNQRASAGPLPII